MPIRALIIAIERYPSAVTLPRGTLQGTSAGALAFRRWLIDDKHVSPEHIAFCADEGVAERTTGTTRAEIIAARGQSAQPVKNPNAFIHQHYNGVTSWGIDGKGEIKHVYA